MSHGESKSIANVSGAAVALAVSLHGGLVLELKGMSPGQSRLTAAGERASSASTGDQR